MLGGARSGLRGAAGRRGGGAEPVQYILNADWTSLPNQTFAAATVLDTPEEGVFSGTLTVGTLPITVAPEGHLQLLPANSWKTNGLLGGEKATRGGVGRITLFEMYNQRDNRDLHIAGHLPNQIRDYPKNGIGCNGVVQYFHNGIITQLWSIPLSAEWFRWAMIERDGAGFDWVYSIEGSPWTRVEGTAADSTGDYYACWAGNRSSLNLNLLRKFKITETLFPDLLLPGADYSILDTI